MTTAKTTRRGGSRRSGSPRDGSRQGGSRRSGNRQGVGETLIKSIVRQMGRRVGTILVRLLLRGGR